ncbi:MAG: class I SAM-dependent methyltransferase [Hydrogenophaga sp.]|uniref:class I SAM-dependent methyltransferase n=1 Tax=Hydrogenophaga sp. TaxID=1904254 RepID=UPI0025C4FC70|nr:class I SAM-dependent methyltransferase [Hydrogenophaga sp.]MBU7574853.1 class I SAM-dependent methyltransferase [Hydrogenophaga sp.]
MNAPVHPLETAALRRWRRLSARGATAAAEAVLWDALAQEPNLPGVHVALARLRWPGPDYRHWLAWFHQQLKPRIYLELGVEHGHTLALAGPDTRVIGVDPSPKGDPLSRCAGPAQLHRCTSAEFFADVPVDSGLTDTGFDLAFIDGDHRFDTVLDDVIGAERLAAPGAVLLLHDTVPLTAETAGREHRTGFHTGDGWKIVPCLRALRPDLRIVTLPTAPSGLTVVTGLDPSNTRLSERRAAIRESYARLPPDAALQTPARMLALVVNDPEVMRRWLRQAAGAR